MQALRRLFVELAKQGHPLGGFQDSFPAFWGTVLGSAALCARVREAIEELEAHLADLLADTDPHPRLTAEHIAAVDHALDTLAGGPT